MPKVKHFTLEPGEVPNYAERIFDGVNAEAAIESELDKFWPDLVDHVGFDQYDQSLEVYFVRATPSDLALTAEKAEIIFGWGFNACWLNFADSTEQYCTNFHVEKGEAGTFIFPRKKVEHPSWLGETD